MDDGKPGYVEHDYISKSKKVGGVGRRNIGRDGTENKIWRGKTHIKISLT